MRSSSGIGSGGIVVTLVESRRSSSGKYSSVGWLYPLDGEGGLGEVGRENYAAATLGIRRDGGLGSRGDK